MQGIQLLYAVKYPVGIQAWIEATYNETRGLAGTTIAVLSVQIELEEIRMQYVVRIIVF